MRAGRYGKWFVVVGCVAGLLASAAPAQAQKASGTPREMVETYQALADSILAVKKTEEKLVRSILNQARAMGGRALDKAHAAIKAKDAKAAQAAVEALAADVSQLASEGDNSVGAVRKRLLEGGHHHHADGEAKGIYDEGFVVVTKVAKQAFLASSKALGQMATAPKAEALDAEWAKVQATYDSIMSGK